MGFAVVESGPLVRSSYHARAALGARAGRRSRRPALTGRCYSPSFPIASTGQESIASWHCASSSGVSACFDDVGVALLFLPGEVVRRGHPADVAVDALRVDVELSGRVVAVAVVLVRHRRGKIACSFASNESPSRRPRRRTAVALSAARATAADDPARGSGEEVRGLPRRRRRGADPLRRGTSVRRPDRRPLEARPGPGVRSAGSSPTATRRARCPPSPDRLTPEEIDAVVDHALRLAARRRSRRERAVTPRPPALPLSARSSSRRRISRSTSSSPATGTMLADALAGERLIGLHTLDPEAPPRRTAGRRSSRSAAPGDRRARTAPGRPLEHRPPRRLPLPARRASGTGRVYRLGEVDEAPIWPASRRGGEGARRAARPEELLALAVERLAVSVGRTEARHLPATLSDEGLVNEAASRLGLGVGGPLRPARAWTRLEDRYAWVLDHVRNLQMPGRPPRSLPARGDRPPLELTASRPATSRSRARRRWRGCGPSS